MVTKMNPKNEQKNTKQSGRNPVYAAHQNRRDNLDANIDVLVEDFEQENPMTIEELCKKWRVKYITMQESLIRMLGKEKASHLIALRKKRAKGRTGGDKYKKPETKAMKEKLSQAMDIYNHGAGFEEIGKLLGVSERRASYLLHLERRKTGAPPRPAGNGYAVRAQTEKAKQRDAMLDENINDILALFQTEKPLQQRTIGKRYNVSFDVLYRALVRKFGVKKAAEIEKSRLDRSIAIANEKKKISNLSANVKAKKLAESVQSNRNQAAKLAMGAWL